MQVGWFWDTHISFGYLWGTIWYIKNEWNKNISFLANGVISSAMTAVPLKWHKETRCVQKLSKDARANHGDVAQC